MFPIHFSALYKECRYCGYLSDKYLRNTINGKIIAICNSCYNERLVELAQYFDDSSEDEVTATIVIAEVMNE
jgi:hypothetical protein